MSWQFYLGKKYKQVSLSNGYILEATLEDKINEPLVLQMKINLDKIIKDKNYILANYLDDYNSDFYLENVKLNIGYRFIKKHNLNGNTILLQAENNTYLYPTGNEILNNNFNFSNETFSTINGDGKIINNISYANSRYELIIWTSKQSSQNLVTTIKNEEVSIAGQGQIANILTLTLYSGASDINYTKMPLIYGQEYKQNLISFVNSLLPTFEITSNIDYPITYTIEAKQNIDILNDVLIKVFWRDGGYNLQTGKQKIEIIDSTTDIPKHRLLQANTSNRDMALCVAIKNNYPVISADIVMGNTYIRAGDKVKLDHNTNYINYRSDLIYAGTSIDLLFNYSNDSKRIFLYKTGFDVRKNYLESNLETLSKKLL